MALLVRLKQEISKNQLQMKKKKMLFHQDNTLCHKSIAAMAKLHESHFLRVQNERRSLLTSHNRPKL